MSSLGLAVYASRIPAPVKLLPPETEVHGWNPTESFHSFFSVRGENLPQS